MCVQVTLPAAPTLGLSLSMTPPGLPAVTVGLDVCCKHVSFSISALPIFPPGTFSVLAMLSLNTYMAAAQTYLDNLLPSCPLE